MKDIFKFIIILLFLLVCVFTAHDFISNLTKNDDEYVRLLEQSLNEQIQEKQVYINMLKNEVE